MGKRLGTGLKLPSEHVRRRKEALKKSQADRKYMLNLLPLLLAAVAESGDEDVSEPEPPRIVSTVNERRYWLHTLREAQGQDSWLLDYSHADPDLTLNWEILIENASIEPCGEP